MPMTIGRTDRLALAGVLTGSVSLAASLATGGFFLLKALLKKKRLPWQSKVHVHEICLKICMGSFRLTCFTMHLYIHRTPPPTLTTEPLLLPPWPKWTSSCNSSPPCTSP